MLPTPSELRYFFEVSKTENLSRAAERLGISQPSLSLAIQRLENNIGTQLLLRSKTGVKLTKAGEKLTAKARILLEDWEKLKSEILSEESEISGRYTLGVHPSVALYTLPYFLRDLLETHPKLEVDLKHDLSRKITEEVISFKTDFGIVVNPTRHPDLVIQKLLEDEVTLFTSNKKTPLQDPKSKQCTLICDPSLMQTGSIQKQLQKAKVDFERTITSSNLEVITSLIASGAGIGIVPNRVANQTGSKDIKPLKTAKKFSFKDEICLIYRVDFQKSAASKKIIDFIKKKTSKL